MYQVGDLIIYSGEGVCRVEEIGTPKISGVDPQRVYYTLSPVYREGKIFIPVDTEVFMRPILTREEALELIRAIPGIQANACVERNLRTLTEFYQSLLHSHTCEDLIHLIKSAYEKQQNVLAKGKKPGQVDERFMKRAEDILHGELAIALGIPKEEVPDYIRRSVEEIT